MRDTGDMMEDGFSEDTMMECSGDDASLDHIVNSTNNFSHSAPTIRDAAERLLSLLGMDDNDVDDLLSSEDEGVELDEESDNNDEDDVEDNNADNGDGPTNSRLLHQLAASLAQELNYSQKSGGKSSGRLPGLQRSAKPNYDTIVASDQCMEVVSHDVSCDEEKYSKLPNNPLAMSRADQTLPYKTATRSTFFDTSTSFGAETSPEKYHTARLRIENTEEKREFSADSSLADSWTIGWDSCAAEAIRYLIEDEGLSPHHPSVLAMKSHLEIQRERAFAQYAV